ncbi:hypothetical protein M5X02_29320 [Paenibacillus alvei]|uniref:hypothetical protein n=1 Tax=Paenibacillus alvei TaxID=44250 RepID=UPI000288711C|nr:hypothetical protein [Paenibacillus alvei]EJW14868.1 hypothetical protein PAV_11c02090 [Paenibacillus alvei DSM 29]MCY9544733.1 hypothetical protein [Paenibacillus alvei]MCY9708387.1 hypothetical protein [Paenibacillus alvei]MEC0083271.1 hypothetical protein [Paenibacillus alvei]
MAITLTEKFTDKVDERFKKETLSNAGVNHDYSWEGAKTIKVTAVDTVPMGDYKREGTNRFGQAKELENQLQEMTLTQDKSFSFTIDKMNENETMIKAAEALGRQIRERVVPTVDTYRFGQMVEKAGKKVEEDLTKTNIYEAVVTATEVLDDAEVPENRVIFATPEAIKLLKLCDGYVKAGDLAQDRIIFKGQVAELDGMPVVKVPKARLGANTNFIVTHASATVAPIKLADYRIHQDPPGISGSLVEGRVYFDAFVLDQKKDAVYASVRKTPVTP